MVNGNGRLPYINDVSTANEILVDCFELLAMLRANGHPDAEKIFLKWEKTLNPGLTPERESV